MIPVSNFDWEMKTKMLAVVFLYIYIAIQTKPIEVCDHIYCYGKWGRSGIRQIAGLEGQLQRKSNFSIFKLN